MTPLLGERTTQVKRAQILNLENQPTGVYVDTEVTVDHAGNISITTGIAKEQPKIISHPSINNTQNP